MKKKDILFVLEISLVTVLALVGISYAYFSLDIQGEGKDMVVTTGELRLVFTDGDTINLEDAEPGATINKTITVENTGTDTVYYDLYWDKLENNIARNEMTIKITCESLNSSGVVSGTCEGMNTTPIKLKNILKRVRIASGYKHKYTINVVFTDTKESQNYNKNSSFSGKFGIKENADADTYNCYTNKSSLTQGYKFTNGAYVYSYKQKPDHFQMENLWVNIDEDGWGVQLVNHRSTDPITDKICTTIDGKPIVATSSMFSQYKGSSVDFSTFDTSNVKYMDEMFYGSKIDNLDLSNFDTSNVTTMYWMFYGNYNTSLDLRSFNTSNVTNTERMFYSSAATTLNVRGFDTSNVTNMNSMFALSKATEIDVSGFDTSNVTDMNFAFANINVSNLDLRYFDTSKVTNMFEMFYQSKFDTLNLSNFNTSSVTNMGWMFEYCEVPSLDLSSFNTSNVTNMDSMFSYAKIDSLDLSNFDTSNVTSMVYMFRNSEIPVLDLSNFTLNDNVEMNGMFFNASSKTGYAKDETTASKFNNKDVTNIGSLKFVVKQ